MTLRNALHNAFEYLSRQDVDLPRDILLKSVHVLKAGSLFSINDPVYHDAIRQILIDYFEGGSIVTARNAFKRAMVEAFGAIYDRAWVEAGGVLPVSAEALAWLNTRVDAEMGYIDMLFQQARELRGEPDFDYHTWANQRADGYVNTLTSVYNMAAVRAMKKSQMVTFDGDDGAESCDTCQWLKGQRHRLSWFIAHDYIPPFGGGLDCAKGGKCKHGLFDEKGYQITR